MIKPNTFGKLSCIYGVPSFVFCSLAAHSQQHRVSDVENPFLSTVINILLKPVNYIDGLLSTPVRHTEPTMSPLGLNHVFESEAVIAFFIVGIIFSAAALYFAVRAARNKEFSLWYSNGAFASISALILTNGYLGALAAVATASVIFKVRGCK